MPRPQFSLKTMLWLTLAVAVVLTEWAMIDLVAEASESGELRGASLLWMGTACLAAWAALIAFRP
jgi:hypothetical protein